MQKNNLALVQSRVPFRNFGIRNLLIFFLMLGVFLLADFSIASAEISPSSSSARTINLSGKFSFSYPDDWVLIPINIAKEKYAEAFGENDRNKVSLAFQLDQKSGWFTFPYLFLMQSAPYTGNAWDKLRVEFGQESCGDLKNKPAGFACVIDEEHHVLSQSAEMNGVSVTHVFFVGNDLVTEMFLSTDNKGRDMPIFISIIKSFSYDGDRAYSSNAARNSLWDQKIIAEFGAILIIGLVLIFAEKIRRYFKRR